MDESIKERVTKKSISSIVSDLESKDYPKGAVPVGTYARSIRLKRLGIIIDAFYGEEDLDGNKIIIYTVFLFPPYNRQPLSTSSQDEYYISNEYEYEIIAYLMMNPVDISKVSISYEQEEY
jgi:hypothetical protein